MKAGLDYEVAKRIIAAHPVEGSTLTPEELGDWLREARELGWGSLERSRRLIDLLNEDGSLRNH